MIQKSAIQMCHFGDSCLDPARDPPAIPQQTILQACPLQGFTNKRMPKIKGPEWDCVEEYTPDGLKMAGSRAARCPAEGPGCQDTHLDDH